MSEPPIAKLPGLAYVASRKLPDVDAYQHCYQFTIDADDETVRGLLACISDVRELTFFDPEHPQLTDAGAYISMVHSPEGFLAQAANHGWSSSWVPIEHEEAERYVRLCVPFHIQPQSEQIVFTEPSNWRRRRSVSRSRWAPLRRYLNKRLAGAV